MSTGSAQPTRTEADGLALAGTTVVELDRGIAAYAGKQFSDLGARVVKVEEPGGSVARLAEPIVEGRSVPFDHYNTGKLSVTIDVGTADGISALRELIASADIVLDGWAPGELARLGLSDDELAVIRPGLVHVIVSPFGATGPWSERLGSDLIGLAAGGVAAGTGYDTVGDTPARPIAPTGGQAAHLGGILAATLAVAALSEPRLSGVRTLDVSLHDVVAVSTEIPVSLWEFGRQTVFRHTGRHASAELHSPEWQFRCGDGSYVCAITLYMNDRRFASIIDWFDEDGLGDVLRDERFATEAGRTANMHEIAAVMGRFFALHDADWIFHESQRRQLPWARVQDPLDLVNDPQLRSRDFFSTWVSADGVEVLQAGLPWVGLPSIFTAVAGPEAATGSATAPRRVRAPKAGEDTTTILGDRVAAR